MTAFKKIINFNTLTVAEADNFFFVPTFEQFSKIHLSEITPEGIKNWKTEYNMTFIDVVLNGPSLPRKNIRGMADVGMKKPSGTFMFPSPTDSNEDFIRKKDAFTHFDMGIRAAGVFNLVFDEMLKMKIDEKIKKIIKDFFVTFKVQKYNKIPVYNSKTKKATIEEDQWGISLMVNSDGTIKIIKPDDMMQFLEQRVGEEIASLIVSSFGEIVSKYTTSKKGENKDDPEYLILKEKILTPVERKVEVKEGSKYSSDKRSHFITAEYMTPKGVSLRKQNEEHMKIGDKELDGNDESIPISKFGVRVELAYVDQNGTVRKPSCTGKSYVDWFDTTEEVRNNSDKPSLAQKVAQWNILKAFTQFKADDYPLPFVNRPSTETAGKIRAVVIVNCSSFGYGSETMKTHYSVGFSDAICVLPLPVGNGHGANSIYEMETLGLETHAVISGAAFAGTSALSAPEGFA